MFKLAYYNMELWEIITNKSKDYFSNIKPMLQNIVGFLDLKYDLDYLFCNILSIKCNLKLFLLPVDKAVTETYNITPHKFDQTQIQVIQITQCI